MPLRMVSTCQAMYNNLCKNKLEIENHHKETKETDQKKS